MSRTNLINWISIKNSCPQAYQRFIDWYKQDDPNAKPEMELGNWKNGRPSNINLETFLQFFETQSVFVSVIPKLKSKNTVTYDVVEATWGRPTDKSELNATRFEAMVLAVKFGFSVLEAMINKGWKRKIKQSYQKRHRQKIQDYEDTSLAPHNHEDNQIQETESNEEEKQEQKQTKVNEQDSDEEEHDTPTLQEQHDEELGEQERQFVDAVPKEWESFLRQATSNDKPELDNSDQNTNDEQ